MKQKENRPSEENSFVRVMWREIVHDKLALLSLIVFTAVMATVFIGSMFYTDVDVNKVDLRMINAAPGEGLPLGADPSGRDMVGQLMIGARNSILIAFGVTVMTGIIGIFVGLVSGYFAGSVDNAIMRVVDFLMMLPGTMLIIVIVTLVPDYTIGVFILVMTAFGWMGKARLMRAKTLQQSNLDYVYASKTLGTPNIVIMLREVLPNIVSLIIVNLTLNLAANMGLETSLSFLGFGLPFSTPSLGTLLRHASVAENMQMRPWQWLPAALLILVMMLCINFVGQAIKRSADAKQRKI
jgi:peptide/nickel transport system permease protein